jgi:hypothetical protein
VHAFAGDHRSARRLSHRLRFPGAEFVANPVGELEPHILDPADGPQAALEEFQLHGHFFGRFLEPDEGEISGNADLAARHLEFQLDEIDPPAGKFLPDTSADLQIGGFPQAFTSEAAEKRTGRALPFLVLPPVEPKRIRLIPAFGMSGNFS